MYIKEAPYSFNHYVNSSCMLEKPVKLLLLVFKYYLTNLLSQDSQQSPPVLSYTCLRLCGCFEH